MTKVARREFLRIGSGRGPRRAEIACERLYMRYLDSLDELNSPQLLASVERDIEGAATVQVTGAGWLAREDFHTWIEPLFERLRTRGVRVVFEPRT